MTNQALQRYLASAVAEEVKTEIERSERKYGPFHSLHEGIAVLREEFQELENEIFWGVQKKGHTRGVRAEAVQTAAMAMRIAMTVSPSPDKDFSVTDAESEVD